MAADPPDEPRFVRREKGRHTSDAGESPDPEDESIFAGWRTIQRWELALFLGTFIGALLIWNIFIYLHRGTP